MQAMQAMQAMQTIYEVNKDNEDYVFMDNLFITYLKIICMKNNLLTVLVLLNNEFIKSLVF